MGNFQSLNQIRKHWFRVLILALFFSVLPPLQIARAAVLTRPASNLGLVGYWPLDEGRGTKAGDASGNGYAATFTGSPAWASGKRAGALNFNGSDTWLTASFNRNVLKNGQETGAFTLSAWVKPSGTQNSVESVIMGRSGCHGGLAARSDNAFGFHLAATDCWTSGTFLSSGAISDWTNWHHVAGVYNNRAMSIYVDGVLKNSANFSPSASIFAYNDNFYLGGIGSNPLYLLNGIMDDARVYNRALSAAEVTKLYSSGQTTYKQASNLGLVGYWSFNEGRGGQAGDSSGRNNTGTIYSAAWTAGKRGNALDFNGSSSYVSIPTISIPSDITVSAWVYSDNFNQNGFVVGKNPVNAQWELFFEGVQFRWRGGSPTSNTISCNNPSNGNWHHLVGIQSGTSAALYLDGAQCISGSITAIGNGSDTIDIGRFNGGYYFNGLIDDVRIYSRAFLASEVSSLYQSKQRTDNAGQNGELTSGLVGLWSFNGQDVSGSTVYDRSGQGRNGTITGSAPLAAGKVGQAIAFKNSGQYVQSGSVFSEFGTSNQPYTIAGWVKINSGVSSGNVVFMGDSWCLPPVNITGGKLRATSWNGGEVDALGTTVLSPNTWYHFATTWDAAGGLKIFVNGSQENSAAMANFSAAGSARIMRAGYSPGSCAGDTGALNGAVDEIRIYNRALSADEIKQLYNMGK